AGSRKSTGGERSRSASTGLPAFQASRAAVRASRAVASSVSGGSPPPQPARSNNVSAAAAPKRTSFMVCSTRGARLEVVAELVARRPRAQRPPGGDGDAVWHAPNGAVTQEHVHRTDVVAAGRHCLRGVLRESAQPIVGHRGVPVHHVLVALDPVGPVIRI